MFRMDANAKNIVKLVSNALEENFDANFYDLIVWRIAFFLSIKSVCLRLPYYKG